MPRKHRQYAQSRRDRRFPLHRRHASQLHLTRLEDRTVPSAALFEVPASGTLLDRGDFYSADGREIRLYERAGALVVRLAVTSDEDPLSVLSSEGMFAGFAVERQLDATTFVLRGPSDWAGPL